MMFLWSLNVTGIVVFVLQFRSTQLSDNLKLKVKRRLADKKDIIIIPKVQFLRKAMLGSISFTLDIHRLLVELENFEASTVLLMRSADFRLRHDLPHRFQSQRHIVLKSRSFNCFARAARI